MPAPQEIIARIEELRQQIRHHDRLYYLDAQPEISDRAYDALYTELKQLEREFPELITPDSPTQRMHGGTSEGFVTVPHTVPMLSLENTYNTADLERFHESVLRGLHGETPTYVIEPKIDGISLAVRYENGVMVQAVTRGNGKSGDDVTANIRTIPSIPLRLATATPPAFFEARGECYMPRSGFALLNDRRQAEGLEPFANARNATAGSVKLLNPAEVAQRPLDVYFYTQGRIDGVAIDSQQGLLECFTRFGLRTQRWVRIAHDFAGILAAIQELDHDRRDFPYDTDGAVIKVDLFSQRERLGMTAKAPCWAKAYKFEPERAATKLRGITIQVGRTGILAPVAELEPVFLSGSTIARATLHNEDEIARLDIRIGDTVLIEKAGEVIPAVVKVLTELRPADATRYDFCAAIDGKCPSCGQPVSRDPQFAAWRCQNLQCPAQNVRRVEFFAARNALDIEGLGGVVAEALCEQGLVNEPLDLYNLTLRQLGTLNLGTRDEPRLFGEKNAAKLLAALEAARTKPLGNWLLACGIPDVGEATAYHLGRIHKGLADVADSFYLKALLDLLDYQAGGRPTRTIPPTPLQPDLFDQPAPIKPDQWTTPLLRAGLIRKSTARGGAYVTTCVGPQTAKSVLEFFAGPIGRHWLERLTALGIHPLGENQGAEQPAADKADADTTTAAAAALPLAGKTFVLTGTLSSMDRDTASAHIRRLGGNAASAVSRNTTYLVAGANTGARKTEKAAALGVAVIDEDAFLKLIGMEAPAKPAAPEELVLMP